MNFLSGCTVLAMSCYSVGKALIAGDSKVDMRTGTPLALGIMSSFLGIGGGPINLVVLYFFFSMDTKTAASNSLYIILFSRAASMLMTLVTRTVPTFQWPALILMVLGGLLGGMLGRKVNKKLDNAAVDKLFIGLMVIIIGISIFNAWQYSH